MLALYLSVASCMRCGWQIAGISTIQIWVSQLHPRGGRGRTCVVGLVATARTDSNCGTMVQRVGDTVQERVTYIPLVFPCFRRESRFHLPKGFLQKGFVDKRITEGSFEVNQSCKDCRDVFSVRLRVDGFVTHMRQAIGGTIGDQFLNRRLPMETNDERSRKIPHKEKERVTFSWC